MTPDTALAHLGSEVHPKGYQQFEAVAFENGVDGKPHTADDVNLGPVDATWSVEEFMAVYGDDDKNFVGTFERDRRCLLPRSDGPNPERKFSRNNYGDVWVVATGEERKGQRRQAAHGQVLSGRDGSDLHQMGSAGGK